MMIQLISLDKMKIQDLNLPDTAILNRTDQSDQNLNQTITKTRLYNFDPLKPHFYIVKLEFQWHTLFFLFLLKNKDCGYLLESPRRGDSNEYQQSMF